MSESAALDARVKAVPVAPDRFVNVLRSEWTKLWSARSTMWSFIVFVAITIGLSALFSLSLAASWDQIPESEQGLVSNEVVTLTISGLYLGQLAIVTLGTLAITGEYATGAIRTTLTAVPRRLQLLAAKGLVVAAVSLSVALLTMFAAFWLGQAVLAAEPTIHVSLRQPEALRIVAGAALYVTACAMLGFALGALLRHTAGAIASALGVLFVLPIVGNFLPGDWGQTVNKYLNAPTTIINARPSLGDALGAWEGYAVFSLWWIVVLTLAAFLIRRRDA